MDVWLENTVTNGDVDVLFTNLGRLFSQDFVFLKSRSSFFSGL